MTSLPLDLMEEFNYSDPVLDYHNEEEHPVPPVRVFVSCVFCIVFISGVMGNVLVLRVTFKSPDRMFSRCIFHMAIANLLFLLSLPFWAYDAVADWIFGNFMCHAITALWMLGLYGNIFMLVLTVLCHVMHWKASFKMAAFVWTSSLLASLPDVVFRREIKDHYGTFCIYHFPSPAWLLFTILSMNLLSFLIPLIIVVLCFSPLPCKPMRGSPDREPGQIRFITLLAVVVVYFLFWAPYNITVFLIVLETHGFLHIMDYDAIIWVMIIAFSHCSLNPIIYILTEPTFRRDAIKTVREFFARFNLTRSTPAPAIVGD